MNEGDKHQHYMRAEQLLAEQNGIAAVIAGAVAMVLAAVAYAVVVKLVPVAHGFAAAGVGAFVGFVVGFLGRGVSVGFVVLASAYTIAGCILGNLYSKALVRATESDILATAFFREHSLAELAERSVSGLTMFNLVFWFVAIFAAGYWARRPLSREDKLSLGMYELR